MRQTINVIWVDDDIPNSYNNISPIFIDKLRDFGYKGNIAHYKSIAEAEKCFLDKSKRIDFFISDFDLGNKTNGFLFLTKTRKNNFLKEYFILYSKISKKSLDEQMAKEISSNNSALEYLNNFSCFSSANDDVLIAKSFETAIKKALIRWDELSALRGEVAHLNCLAEWITRKILKIVLSDDVWIAENGSDTKNYFECIKELNSSITRGDLVCTVGNIRGCFDKWHKLRKRRNAIEHHSEKWDQISKDFFIPSDDGNIFEKDIVTHRKNLLLVISAVRDLLVDLIENNGQLAQLKNDDDYLTFTKVE